MSRKKAELFEYKGKRQTLGEWSKELKIPYNTLYRRVYQRGWTGDRIFKPVSKPRHQEYEHLGRRQTLEEWSEELGIPMTNLLLRISKGTAPPELFERGNLNVLRRKKYRHNGKSMSLREWSEELGIGRGTLQSRIAAGKTGDALFAPIQKKAPRGKKYAYRGEEKTLIEWSNELNISPSVLYQRVKKGLTGNELFEGFRSVKAGRAKLYEHQGKSQSISDWSRELGISAATLYERRRRGLVGEELFKPVRAQRKNPKIPKKSESKARTYEHQGKEKTLVQWSEELGLSLSCLRYRLKKGKTGEELFAAPKHGSLGTFEYRGQSRTLSEWSFELGIPYATLVTRNSNGFTGEKLFKKVGIHIEYEGRTQSLVQWSKETGIHYQTLRQRWKTGKRGKELFKKCNDPPRRNKMSYVMNTDTLLDLQIEGSLFTLMNPDEGMGLRKNPSLRDVLNTWVDRRRNPIEIYCKEMTLTFIPGIGFSSLKRESFVFSFHMALDSDGRELPYFRLPMEELFIPLHSISEVEIPILPPNIYSNVPTKYTVNGVSLSIAQWAKKAGVKEETIRRRIERGDPIETALTKRCYERTKKLHTYKGETKNAKEWAKKLGISTSAFYQRISRGKTGAELFAPLSDKPSAKLYTYKGETKTAKEWAKKLGIATISFYQRISRGKTGAELFAPKK